MLRELLDRGARASSSSTRCARRSAATVARLPGPAGRPRRARRHRAARAQPRARSRRDRRRASLATATAPARTTATSRAWRCCSRASDRPFPAPTVNRLCGSGLEAVIAAEPRDRVGDHSIVHRRRRRVDEPRAMGDAQARAWVPRRPTRRCSRRRSAGGWSTRGCRRNGRSRSVKAPRCSPTSTASPRGAGRVRAAQPPARAAARGTPACTRRGRAGPGRRPRARRVHPRRHLARGARAAGPGVLGDGTVTAGNASPLNDGAGAVLLADADGAQPLGREPLARIVSRGGAPSSRTCTGSGRWRRRTRRSQRAGIGWEDLAVVELNEAFAAQSLACLRGWPELDPDKVNPNGGAIAIGHPIGARARASSARLRTSCAAAAAATGSRRSASASARASPSSWRLIRWPTSTRTRTPADLRPDHRHARLLPARARGHPSAARLRRVRVDAAAPPQAAARLPAQTITESPARCSAATARRRTDHDLTGQHEGEPIGERITVSGRVLDTEGKPLRGTLVEVWQANAAGRYAHRSDRSRRRSIRTSAAPGAASPTTRAATASSRSSRARTRGATTPTPGVRRTSTSRCLGALRAATRHADVLPGRPALPVRPDLQLDPRRAGARAADLALLDPRQPDWALAYEWDIVLRGPGRRRSRRHM